jgi:hypothetical protein
MIAGWDNFFVAEVGASAALAGLLFVGISINMTKILALPWLANMGLRALSLLVSILIVASVLLIPGQNLSWLGIEQMGLGVVAFLATSWISITTLRAVKAPYRGGAAFLTATVMGTTILYPVAGAVILFVGAVGVYFLAPAILLSFVIAIFDAWVLLVEINR